MAIRGSVQCQVCASTVNMTSCLYLRGEIHLGFTQILSSKIQEEYVFCSWKCLLAHAKGQNNTDIADQAPRQELPESEDPNAIIDLREIKQSAQSPVKPLGRPLFSSNRQPGESKRLIPEGPPNSSGIPRGLEGIMPDPNDENLKSAQALVGQPAKT